MMISHIVVLTEVTAIAYYGDETGIFDSDDQERI